MSGAIVNTFIELLVHRGCAGLLTDIYLVCSDTACLQVDVSVILLSVCLSVIHMLSKLPQLWLPVTMTQTNIWTVTHSCPLPAAC